MGKNNKVGSLKAPEKALAILEKYADDKNPSNGLIFPDLKDLPNLNDAFAVKYQISLAVSSCNRALKLIAAAEKIEGTLSTRVARHTFATLAGDKIPLQMLQKLYRHSDVRTTMGYQSAFIYKDADESLEAVIGK